MMMGLFPCSSLSYVLLKPHNEACFFFFHNTPDYLHFDLSQCSQYCTGTALTFAQCSCMFFPTLILLPPLHVR